MFDIHFHVILCLWRSCCLLYTWLPPAQRSIASGIVFSSVCLGLSLFVRMFVSQHDNSWTVRDTCIITKFSGHHLVVRRGGWSSKTDIVRCASGDLSLPMFYFVTLAPPGEWRWKNWRIRSGSTARVVRTTSLTYSSSTDHLFSNFHFL